MEMPKRDETEQAVLDLLKTSKDALEKFRKEVEDKYVVIFVGNTRSGKSTLLNYLAKVPLTSVPYLNTFRIECINKDNCVTDIRHGSLSCTSKPILVEIPSVSDTLIIDAPGFDDNRGAVQETFNALYINQIKYAKGVKFVLVADVADILSDNINQFLTFITTVNTIMPNFDKLQKTVSIIFTKATANCDKSEIVSILQDEIVSAKGLHCDTKLVEHFVEHPALIGIFKVPEVEGAISDNLIDNVKEIIFNGTPININDYDIKFGVSSNAKIVLLNAYGNFYDVLMFVKDIIKNDSTLIMSTFKFMEGEKLWDLNDSQLKVIEHSIKEYHNKIKVNYKVKNLVDICVTLNRLFIKHAQELTISLQQFQRNAHEKTAQSSLCNAQRNILIQDAQSPVKAGLGFKQAQDILLLQKFERNVEMGSEGYHFQGKFDGAHSLNGSDSNVLQLEENAGIDQGLIIKGDVLTVELSSQSGILNKETQSQNGSFAKTELVDEKAVQSEGTIEMEIEPSKNDVLESLRCELEYLICIEKVVNKNSQSRDILNCYNTSILQLSNDLERLCIKIQREIVYRKKLHAITVMIPDLKKSFSKIDKQYIMGSTTTELNTLKNYTQQTSKLMTDIKCRPFIDKGIVESLIQQTGKIMQDIADISSIKLSNIDLIKNRSLFRIIPNRTVLDSCMNNIAQILQEHDEVDEALEADE